MVRLHEHQGKKLLKELAIPVPMGRVVSTPQEAKHVAEEIGKPVVIKAQIWSTGRFKAGGIRFAENPLEAERIAAGLLHSDIKGFRVGEVLIEEKLPVEKEFYAGVVVDDSYKVKAPSLIFSTQGGVDIEEVAAKSPEKVSRMNVDVLHGIGIEDAQSLVKKLAVPVDLVEPLGKIVFGIYEVFQKYNARSAEINPIILAKNGEVYAADCRVVIDEASVFKHPELGIEHPRDIGRPLTDLEKIAWKIEEEDFRGIGYFIQMVKETAGGGYIGFHGIGGGGAMLGADALMRHGLKIADYVDTSGNPTASKVYRMVKLIFSQPDIEGYVLMGAVVANQEQWHHAHALVKALKEELRDRPNFPVVILIAGNKERESIEILKEGLGRLPVKMEIYGRKHVYDVDHVAERMGKLVEEYRKFRNKGG